jgi:hypothetical protein
MEVVKEADDASGSKMSEVVVRVDVALVKGNTIRSRKRSEGV